MRPSPLDILQEYWGYDRFRPLQEEIIQAVLDGKDVLALLPTGGGKSICYQVPAMLMDGLCLVISPLIALMKDQVENLNRRGITAYAIFSGMPRREVERTFRTVMESNCRFLYVSPERLETALFREYLPGLDIRLLAVDEAHCISQWGYDFRPPYLRIATIREELPGVPVLALTASATPAVQQDITEKLAFTEPVIFRQSFERPNLSYSCIRSEARYNKVLDILQKVPGTGIVYCRSRKRSREMAELLQLQGISADFYHAGLEPEERSRKQEAWIKNSIRVITCTNAFGMGIDKPDVRVVIHADVPDCLENYYQEAGRAGRDGKKAYAVLLYDEADLRELEAAAAIRFPAVEDIRHVYQAVANYLQVPTGAGKGEYYDFDLTDFTKKFRLSPVTSVNALKTLEQEDWIAFNEQVFLPPTIRFTTDKQNLYLFEKENPALAPCIKTLLRAYEGIFDQYTAISEKQIAGLLRKELALTLQELQALDRAGILEYRPRKDKPQLCYLRERSKAEDIRINMAAYEERKKQFGERTRAMLSYVQDKTGCRSRQIAVYFGDASVQDCGICDNCIARKEKKISPEEVAAISARILSLLKEQPLHQKEMMTRLSRFNKEKAWTVIGFLQAENKIGVDAEGIVRLK